MNQDKLTNEQLKVLNTISNSIRWILALMIAAIVVAAFAYLY